MINSDRVNFEDWFDDIEDEDKKNVKDIFKKIHDKDTRDLEKLEKEFVNIYHFTEQGFKDWAEKRVILNSKGGPGNFKDWFNNIESDEDKKNIEEFFDEFHNKPKNGDKLKDLKEKFKEIYNKTKLKNSDSNKERDALIAASNKEILANKKYDADDSNFKNRRWKIEKDESFKSVLNKFKRLLQN